MEKNKVAFEYINSAFRELSLNQEQFNSELIALVFGDGAYMENFIHGISTNIDEIHQTRFRVLLCFDRMRYFIRKIMEKENILY